MAQSNSLPVIDWDQKSRFGNNSEDLQKELLMMFAIELPDIKKNVRQYYEEKNFKELHTILHKLQGGCAYCGLPRLKAAAAELSAAMKTNAFSLDQLVREVCSDIEAVLVEIKQKYPK